MRRKQQRPSTRRPLDMPEPSCSYSALWIEEHSAAAAGEGCRRAGRHVSSKDPTNFCTTMNYAVCEVESLSLVAQAHMFMARG